VFVLFTALNGCAVTDRANYGPPITDIKISYVAPDEGKQPQIAGAQGINIHVLVDDQRMGIGVGEEPYRRSPGSPIVEMAPITVINSVPLTLQSAIESELVKRGFSIAKTGTLVEVTLSEFQSRYEESGSSGSRSALGEMAMTVAIKKRDGTTTYSKQINAQGHSTGILGMVGVGNKESALKLALQQAVTDLFADSHFIDALLAAGQNNASRSGEALPASSP
jgi:uncharacterized lipoprotein YajG